MSAVGGDDAGHRIRKELRTTGVDTSLAATVDAPTGTALIVVDDAGENQIAAFVGICQSLKRPEIHSVPASSERMTSSYEPPANIAIAIT